MGEAATRLIAERDDALMARIGAREGTALRLISDAHAPAVWRIAYRMLGDAAEAEDIAQESLLKLWNYADRWQAGRSGIAAWLKTTTVNLCLDRLRRKRFISDGELPERADIAALADALMLDDELRTMVKRCIENLPDRQRVAVVLTYYEEQTNKNAADILTMQLKAFESLLFRARSSLRGCVERKGILSGEDI
jgi:RNA polymerase sigma factor (sigma-70 family)